MTVVFKHMEEKYAKTFSEGEVHIGSMVHYQQDEHASDIQDALEGETVGKVDNLYLTTTNEVPEETIVAGQKFSVATGGKIIMGNTQFRRQCPPSYIYSTSIVGTIGLFKGRDTVVRINDIESFGKILVDERRDLFQGYSSDCVQYEPRIYDAINHDGINPDPFVKDIKFSPDKEFRLVLTPEGRVRESLTFSLDGIKQAFKDGLCELT